MAERGLHVTIRTPHAVVYEAEAASLRVPTESGQVGLRPRAEATLLAVEVGLVLVHTAAGNQFVGTAGGLLSCDGAAATLLTPLAVVGDTEQAILDELELALQEPSEEMQARITLGKIEGEILHEIRWEQQDRLGRHGEASHG
jgi:F0F1-type ATP synthase epsilon subunit